MTRPRVNPWDNPANVDVTFLDSDDSPRPKVRVIWETDGALVTAYLENIGGAIQVTAFDVQGGPDGIPNLVRRLPSDVLVLQVVRRFGPMGLMALAYLGDDRGILTEIANRHNVSGAELSSNPAAMQEYSRELARRPKAKIQREITLARELRDGINGEPPLRSRQVVEHLMQVAGLSEQTAWRRLRSARSETERTES